MLATDHRAQRQAAGDALAEQQQIRLDAQPREGEALAGAAEAGLDLVDDQHDVALVAEAPQILGEACVQRLEAALALHRLEDDAADFLDVDLHVEQALHGGAGGLGTDAVVGARVRQVVDRAGQAADLLLVGGDLAVEVQRGQGAAVEAAVEGDHRAAPGGGADDLQGVLGGLGAAVGEHAGQAVGHRHEARQGRQQLAVALVGQRVECRVGQPPGLPAHRLDDARVAVAEVEHADAADEVDVALALGIPDLGVAAVAEADRVDDGQGLADVGRLHGRYSARGFGCAS
ncbi:hypothetical protein D9M71_364400 [compost metagenome]